MQRFPKGWFILTVLGLVAALVFTAAGGALPVRSAAPSASITVQYNQIVSASPPAYGTNGWWTDQDAAVWNSRYSALSANMVRVPIPHFAIEPVNDNADPALINWSAYLFDQPVSVGGSRTLTFSNWLQALKNQDVTLLVHFPYLAPWLSDNPAHPGAMAPFPPNNNAEYQEFVTVVLRYMIEQVQIPPERILVEVVNEPDLPCGADPATPCFWQNWGMDNLRQVVAVTGQAVQAVAPQVRMVGLSECCGTTLARDLLNNHPEGTLLDGITYHYYAPGSDLSAALQRASDLKVYGLPVYLNEYGSYAVQSNGIPGALWHSTALSTFWKAGISPVQYAFSDWAIIGSPYSSMGLFADWNGDWAEKPSFWVYRSFFSRFGGSSLVSFQTAAAVDVIAARGTGGSLLNLWVTHPGTVSLPAAAFEIQGFPAGTATVSVFDNMQPGGPLDAFVVSGSPLQFTYALPPQSSLTFAVTPAGSQSLTQRIYLPLLVR